MTNERDSWHAAYTLHTQAYKENSLLITCFTEQMGVMTLLFKGAKRRRNLPFGVRNYFQLLELQFQGRHSLKILTQLEMRHPPVWLVGKAMVSGLYLNELLYRVLPKEEPFPEIFKAYHHTIAALQGVDDSGIEAPLRYFELTLLQALGYGLSLNLESDHRTPVELGNQYRYNIEQGFVLDKNGPYSGDMLLAFQQLQLQGTAQLKQAKLLMRQVLQHYLPHVLLNSRQFYKELYYD